MYLQISTIRPLNSLIMPLKAVWGKVYRPIGMEWGRKCWYWKVYDHPAATQARGINAATPHGSQIPHLKWRQGSVVYQIGTEGKRIDVSSLSRYWRRQARQTRPLLLRDLCSCQSILWLHQFPSNWTAQKAKVLWIPSKPPKMIYFK